MLKNVVFLDRDGVINKDSPEYIKSWTEFEFLPGSREAIAKLTAAARPVIIITNQSIIGRKMSAPADLDHIFDRMQTAIEAAGGRVLDIFYCPHHPQDNCKCRKPRPGMVLEAVQKHDIDLASACFVGDSAKDIQCARAAGCACSVLVRSGRNHESARKQLDDLGITPDRVSGDLADAVEWILRHGPQSDSPEKDTSGAGNP